MDIKILLVPGLQVQDLKMSKILILGSAPLPFMKAKRLYGPGIRTWQFAQPLIQAGHQVRIIAGRAPASQPTHDTEAAASDRSVDLTVLEQADFERIGPVSQHIQDFAPDAIVAAGYGASRVAVGLGLQTPIWADFFGDPMAEAQAMAHVHEDDEKVHVIWSYIAPVLDRADKFSAVSERQRYAVIGQLASRGRLNRWTMGSELVHCVPCGIAPIDPTPMPAMVRGKIAPSDGFLVLWTGGYNTWADADVLFGALERAMLMNSRIHFVSTGGSINGHDEVTYPRFCQRIAASNLKDRFHLLGWLETGEVRALYQECDIGINVDRPCYEGLLGSRNRILDWMEVGLPVLTTETCELSSILRQMELGFTVPTQAPKALSEAILGLSQNTTLLKERAQRARDYARFFFSFQATAQPVLAWASAPRPAPDRGRAPRLGNFWAVASHKGLTKLRGLRQVSREEGIQRAGTILMRGLLRRLSTPFRRH